MKAAMEPTKRRKPPSPPQTGVAPCNNSENTEKPAPLAEPLPPMTALEEQRVQAFKDRRRTSEATRGCGSAWKKDPVEGVIGVQSGPL